MNKNELRREFKSRLAAISPQERIEKSRQICGHILDSKTFQEASVVMLFLSLPHEVDTATLILAAWQNGKTLAVPKVSWEQRHMIAVEITSLETGLKEERMGLRNPVSGVPVPHADIDMVITPGLGFDRQGNRLGRGGSYYDQFFSAHNLRAPKWGAGFAVQLSSQIPCDPHDVPMDAIVTEQGVIYCSSNVNAMD